MAQNFDFLSTSCSQYVGDDSENFSDDFVTETMAPFVIATITDSNGQSITVGNNSSPWTRTPNSAVIKSFQYGQSNGLGCTLEIVDEDGGSGGGGSGFENFFRKIVHRLDSNAIIPITVKWGWILNNCDGTSSIRATQNTHSLIILKVQIKFESCLKFILECTDTLQLVFQTRSDKTYGDGDNPMKLKDAITQLFQDCCPPINVKFLKAPAEGESDPTPWEFKGDPAGSWSANQTHAIDTAMGWIADYKTENDKGIDVAYDDTDQSVIFWQAEDTGPPKTKPFKNVGNYIVNGGNHSTVISFTPDIMWNFATAARTGGFVDPNTSATIKQDDKQLDVPGEPDVASDCKAGIATYNVIKDTAVRNYGTQAAGVEVATSNKENMEAAQHFGTYQPIKAQLRIVGNPKYDHPLHVKFSTLGIIVINPFHLITTGDNECADWLASGTCNPVLSSKEWQISGIVHDIREGSYTTVFDLYLPLPSAKIGD